jgi:selenocysteine-specific elongation factor
VIAADEGVMPQTKEHLAICELLGMSDGLTVISKADLVNETQLEQVRAQIREFLKDSFLGGKENPIIPVSARSGAGLEKVCSELMKLAMRAKAAEATRPIRLPIDRTFVKKGFGTVVTGTLLSGEISTAQNLVIEPGSRNVRVRGLQTHGDAEQLAQRGSRVAVNLSGVDASEVSRGQTLVVPGEIGATDLIDAEITLLANAPSLKHRARVHLHAFTSEVMAGISLYSSEPVEPGTRRLARLKLSGEIVLAPGDRFVLRQPLPAGTVGGGRVLDANPLTHARRAETRRWLEQIAGAELPGQLVLRVKRRGVQGIRFEALAPEMGLRADAIRDMAADLINRGELLIASGELLFSRDAFSSATELILALLKSAGATGVKRSVLHSQSRLNGEVFSSVLERLVTDNKARVQEEVVTIAGVAPAVSSKEAQNRSAVAAAYQKAGLAAPTVREVAEELRISEAEMRPLITLLLREKTLVRMGSDDAFVHADALRALAERLATMRGKTVDVPAFKVLTGLTRKHAIPLLEYLDRERITRKQGDVRVVL